MRTGNPMLHGETFTSAGVGVIGERMTIEGTVNKTLIMLFILVLAAGWVWGKTMGQEAPIGLMMGGAIGGFIVGLVTFFKKDWAPITAPIYAGLEGLFLGGISAYFETKFPGIVIQAVALTFGTLFCLLIAYRSGMIQVTQNFRLGVVAATGAIMVVYLVSMVMGFFGTGIPFIHEGGTIGILFSLFVVVIAALNLVLDFDFIEHGAEAGAPKFMEWFAAFALMVTLIWLYLEILRLLAKLNSRR
ncbi:MAG TPA: Bax inhibitor-1/YccA family protein [Nitrospiria bacterium]